MGIVIPPDTLRNDSISRKYSIRKLETNGSNDYSIKMPDFPYKSPEAAAFQKYGEFQMNEYTGNPNINIPLYTIKDRDIEIPLALSYDASGIKVGQEASWVGLGWNLNVGGCINLVQAGTLDKYMRDGLWKDYEMVFDVNFFRNCDYYKEKVYPHSDYYEFLGGYAKGFKGKYNDRFSSINQDICNKGLGEIDFFSAHFMGNQILFFLNPHTQKLQMIGHTNDNFEISAIPNFSSHFRELYNYQGFQIKDSQGNIYTFNIKEFSYQGGISYPSAWYLTQIKTQKGTEVKFYYSEQHDIAIHQKQYEEYNFIGDFNNPDISNIGYGAFSTYGTGYRNNMGGDVFKISKPYLLSIESPNISAFFELDSHRNDMRGAMKLNGIKIIHKSKFNTIRSFKFNYSYFVGNNVGGDYTQQKAGVENFAETSSYLRNRLKLLSIDEISSTGNYKLQTSFEYNNLQLPLKSSYARDFWEYYNGEENINKEKNLSPYRTTIPSFLNLVVCHGKINNDLILKFKGANRFANKDYLQAGMLTKINYPTKGSTEFSYEPITFDTSLGLYPDIHTYKNTLTEILANKDIEEEGKASKDIIISDCNNNYTKPNHPISGEIRLNKDKPILVHTEFHSDNKHSMYDMETDGAYIAVVSQQNGESHVFKPSDVGGVSTTKVVTKLSKDICLILKKGTYKIFASLPDKYGATTECMVYASAPTDFMGYNDIADELIDKLKKDGTVSTGGGVRIKGIYNFNKDGVRDTLVSYTTYSYDGGKLLYPLLYGELWIKGDWTTLLEKGYFYGIAFLGYKLSNSSIAKVTNFTKMMSAGTVGYTHVTKSEFSSNGKLLKRTLSQYQNEQASAEVPGFYQFKHYNNGTLVSQTVLQDDKPVYALKKEYSYEKIPYTCNILLTDRVLSAPGTESFQTKEGMRLQLTRYHSIVYSYYQIKNRLIRSESTYYGNGKLASIHEFSYNEKNHQIASDKFNNSESGESYEINYKYPCDFPNDPICTQMTKYHILSPVIEQKFSKGGTELKRIKTQYESFSNSDNGHLLFYPSRIFSSLNGAKLEERLCYNDCDKWGNTRSIVKDHADKMTYLWSYNSTYPIAEIRGATYTEVSSWLGNSFLDKIALKNMLNESDIIELKHKLAPYPVIVTLYLYEPGIGIKEVLSPNGNKTFYKYDSFYRLSGLYNNNSNPIKLYDYNYMK